MHFQGSISTLIHSTLIQGVLSSLIAAIVASVTVLLWEATTAPGEPVLYALGEDGGLADPGPLFDEAREEGYKITFVPEHLQDITVCEYTLERGHSWSELAIGYLQKYPDCFLVRPVGQNDIEVRPNTNLNSQLEANTENTKYWCRCPRELTRATYIKSLLTQGGQDLH